jgi:hypothetical protein
MQLSIEGNQLKIELSRSERFWACHVGKTILVPLDQIQEVSTAVPTTNWQELRSPGTYVPGLIKAGTYYQNRIRSFWYTQPKKPVLTLELSPQHYYRQIVLALDNAGIWVNRLQHS